MLIGDRQAKSMQKLRDLKEIGQWLDYSSKSVPRKRAFDFYILVKGCFSKVILNSFLHYLVAITIPVSLRKLSICWDLCNSLSRLSSRSIDSLFICRYWKNDSWRILENSANTWVLFAPCFMSYLIFLMMFGCFPYFLFIRFCQFDASAGSPVTYLIINFSICSSCHFVNGKLFCVKTLTLFRYAISVYNLIKFQFSSDPIERRIEIDRYALLEYMVIIIYRLLVFLNWAKLDEIQDRHEDHAWILYSIEPVNHLFICRLYLISNHELILVNMISAVFISTLLLILVFITSLLHGDSILW